VFPGHDEVSHKQTWQSVPAAANQAAADVAEHRLHPGPEQRGVA